MKESEQKEIFHEWLGKYRSLFFKFVRAYAFNSQDQEDLFQEITIQVWRSIPNYRGDASVKTWVYRITINTAISWSRKEKKHREGKRQWGIEESLLRIESPADERLDWLYQQIAGFNEIDRTLTMLLLDGFSYKEMSSILGITESNVGVKINRIKNVLIDKSKTIKDHGI